MTRDQLAVSADYIAKVLTEAPPLTDQQRNQLAELLRPARRADRVHCRAVA